MQEVQARTVFVRSIPAEVAAAARFALGAASVGVALLALGALWMSTCTGGTGGDSAACGPVQATLLSLAAPLIVLTAAVGAFWRGYARGGSAWHCAGVFLVVLTAVALIHG